MASNTATRHWTFARTLVAATALITAAGALTADVIVSESAAQHIFNDAWPPHAKFHDAQYIVMTILLGALALFFISRQRGDERANFLTAISLVAIPWLGMFGAMLFPGTAAHDPAFDDQPLVAGVHAQLVIAAVILLSLLFAFVADFAAQSTGSISTQD